MGIAQTFYFFFLPVQGFDPLNCAGGALLIDRRVGVIADAGQLGSFASVEFDPPTP
jgi:hypothetical protein